VSTKAPFSVRKLPGFLAIAAMSIFALYLPICTYVAFAFNSSGTGSSWDGFTLKWFAVAWQNTQIQDAAWRSLQIASVAATAATIMATLAALATTRTAPYRGLTFKYTLINQPLIVPEIVTAVALLIFFARIKVWTGYSGMAYLFVAHAAFCIPFAYLPIRARLEGMDLTLETAAADLYANAWQTFREVTLPLLWPGLLAGYMLAFVISLDDVVITEFVKSGGQDTLPTFMLGQIRRSISPELNAAATGFFALSIVAVITFYMINRRRS
jgi:spermidine/putrescine transport system permease protein